MNRDNESRDDEVRELFDAAGVAPTPAERRAILTAAEPILAEHAAAADAADAAGPGRPMPRPFADRLRAVLTVRPLAFAAAAAVIAAIFLFARDAPNTRDTRSAPLESWMEHLQADPGQPFPLTSERIGRPY